jgi:hypothetical protein
MVKYYLFIVQNYSFNNEKSHQKLLWEKIVKLLVSLCAITLFHYGPGMTDMLLTMRMNKGQLNEIFIFCKKIQTALFLFVMESISL